MADGRTICVHFGAGAEPPSPRYQMAQTGDALPLQEAPETQPLCLWGSPRSPSWSGHQSLPAERLEGGQHRGHSSRGKGWEQLPLGSPENLERDRLGRGTAGRCSSEVGVVVDGGGSGDRGGGGQGEVCWRRRGLAKPRAEGGGGDWLAAADTAEADARSLKGQK